MKYEYVSRSVEQTGRLAQALAEKLPAGSLVALEGELGAGKTTFSQAFAKALGVSDVVNSPTFTIVKQYEARDKTFYHMDVYRICIEEAEELGLDEMFYDSGVTLVEWASRIQELLPAERLEMEMAWGDPSGESRVIQLTPIGETYENICESLRGEGLLL